MQIDSPYRLTAEVSRSGGERVGERPIQVDWNHAAQCAGFSAARRGALPALYRYRRPVEVAPEWDQAKGEPYVKRFMLRLSDVDLWVPIPHSYAHRAVQQVSSALVREGRLQDGEFFTYTVCAYVSDTDNAVAPSDERRGQTLEVIEQAMTLERRSLAELLAMSERCFPGVQDSHAEADADVPVFVHENVLSDAECLARAAGDKENAGFLLGRVHRDSASSELMVELTALIEARDVRSEHAQVTFTAETWHAAQAAVALRREGESVVGWVHNHPWFCANCDPEKRDRCVFRSPFFSEPDRIVHSTSFGGAFQVALLVTDLGKPDLVCSLYGWRDGSIAHRAFYVLKNDQQMRTPPPSRDTVVATARDGSSRQLSSPPVITA